MRKFRLEDAAAVHRWFNSPAATANLLEHRDEFSEEDARAWVERAMDESGEDRKWAVEFAGIEEAVGYTALRPGPPDGPRAGGDRRRRARRRQGVGREAERLTNKRAYEEFGAHKVYGRIPAGNEAAKKAVIYNGWKQEGVMRNHVRHGEELIDVEVWGGFPEDQPAPPDD